MNDLVQRFPFAHTFSIVARDPATGQMGVAVQSHWFSVGSIVPWAAAGVGAIATQSMVNPNYGSLGLDLLRGGLPAAAVLKALLAADEGRDLRQVAIVDAAGRVAAHTGVRCIASAGHLTGDGFSVQANMMANNTIWLAMRTAYLASMGNLSERLLAALDAAQAAGGDIRGQQSAAILVVKAQSSGSPWADKVIDLRVEDHPRPLGELRRLLRLHEAYDLMNAGDEHLSADRIDQALESYRGAAQLAPEVMEMPFWHASTLADLGRMDEALPIFQRVFAAEPQWRELFSRLALVGLSKAHPARPPAHLRCAEFPSCRHMPLTSCSGEAEIRQPSPPQPLSLAVPPSIDTLLLLPFREKAGMRVSRTVQTTSLKSQTAHKQKTPP